MRRAQYLAVAAIRRVSRLAHLAVLAALIGAAQPALAGGNAGWIATASSTADFSNIQGQGGWYYAYTTSSAMNAPISLMEFYHPNGASCGCGGVGAIWSYAQAVCFCGQQFCFQGANISHVNTQGAVQLPVRRFQLPASGRFRLTPTFSHGGGCSGVELMTLQLRFRGSVLWSATSGPGEQTGSVEILGTAGEYVDMITVPAGGQCGGAHIARLAVESADCNGNGVADSAELASGKATDANANGVLDVCECPAIVRVPQDFTTIQAAIDSVPSYCATRIEVAAGTYSGPIDFGGKNIALVGSGMDTCVIDGTGGLPGSVIRATREPSTALLEGFTIRSGTSGSPLPSEPTSLCGGGLLAVESSMRITGCRFSNNISTFGGGAYFYRCSLTVQDTVFAGNTSFARGGGCDVYECTATFLGCSFLTNNSTIGAGLQVVRGSVLLSNSLVQSNHATDIGGGIQWYPNGDGALLTLSATQVASNFASTLGSGLSIFAGSPTQRTRITNASSICGNLPRNVVGGRVILDSSSTVCDCSADIVLDGIVNGADLALLLSNWGLARDGLGADANLDGVVDGADLAFLLSSWGVCESH